jgi:hypothetical protein
MRAQISPKRSVLTVQGPVALFFVSAKGHLKTIRPGYGDDVSLFPGATLNRSLGHSWRGTARGTGAKVIPARQGAVEQ